MRNFEEILSIFSQAIRLRIAILLLDSPLRVKNLVQILNLPQSTVSRHLALLTRSGILKVTRCYYTFNNEDPFAPLNQRLIQTYYEVLKDMEPFKTDMERLWEIRDGFHLKIARDRMRIAEIKI